MRLFDLIKDDDRVWAAAQGFGQLTSILVAHISGRCAHQTGGGVTFHELGHVQLDGGFFTAKHELGEGLCQLGLADACGTDEQEVGYRFVRSPEAGPAPLHCLGYRLYGGILAEHACLEV